MAPECSAADSRIVPCRYSRRHARARRGRWTRARALGRAGASPTSAPSPTRVSDAYGVSLAVVGLVTTALLVTHAAVQIPAGRLCDRFGARLVGLAGLVVVVAASTLALTWRDVWLALAMRFVAGIGTGLAFVAGSDYVRSTIGTRARAGPLRRGEHGQRRARAGARAPLGRLAGAVRDRRDPRGGRRARARRRAARPRTRPPLSPGPAELRRPPPAPARGDAQRLVRALGRDRQLGRDAARAARRRVGRDRRASPPG